MHFNPRKGKITLPFFNPKTADWFPLNKVAVIKEFSTGIRTSEGSESLGSRPGTIKPRIKNKAPAKRRGFILFKYF